MSEPNAGSDLAGLQTRAEVFDDHFVVNGQKVWTSYAMIAQKCFCYVRTDPTLPKHKGISLLILDMDTPGIDIRPLRHINGTAGFAEVFFTDVVVPRENLVGHLNGGWAITQGSLAHERAGLWVEGVARFEQTIDGLVDLARRDRPRPRPDHPAQDRGDRTSCRRRLRSLGYKGFASFAQGSSRTRAQLHEDGDVGGRQGRVRTRHGDLGPARAGHRRRTRSRSGATCTASSCRSRTRSRAAAPRSSATSSPSASSDCRGSSDGLLAHRRPRAAARHRAQVAGTRVPARARARAHRRSGRVRTAVAPPVRVHRARRRRRDRHVPVPRTDRLRGRARAVPRDDAVRDAHRRRHETLGHRRARRRRRPIRSCSKPTGSSGSRSCCPDPGTRDRRRRADVAVEVRPDRRLLAAAVRDRRGRRRGDAARSTQCWPQWHDRAHACLAAEMVGDRAPHLRHGARSTRRNASSSTCRSVRSRRSSTSSPTCRSRSNGRPRPCTTRR